MLKVRIRSNNSVLQEAMRVEDMGLPPLIVIFIKEDIPKNREAQVRLANILKNTSFPPMIISHFSRAFGEWQKMLNDAFEKTNSDDNVDIESLFDRTTKLFQFLFKDMEAASRYEQNRVSGYAVYSKENVKALDLKSIKGIRKSLTKNLTKYGWHSSASKKMNLFLDKMLIQYYNNFVRGDARGEKLVAFLNEHPDNQKDIADMEWHEAVEFVSNYFIEKEDEERIIKRYPKKNLFWYNIGESSCQIERERMGHCGADDRGVLYSLRSKGPKQKVSDSHVTISYNENENAVYQIKGKQNCTPKEKYGPYVVDFLKIMGVEKVHESGEHSDCDFTEFIEYLEEKYPEADYEQSNLRQLEEIQGEIENGDHNTNTVQIYSHLEDYGDEPYIHVTANVSFHVPLDFLVSDEQKHKLKELFEEDEDDNRDEIAEICGFDYFNEYDDADSYHIDVRPDVNYMQVTFDIRDNDGSFCTTREQVENQINSLTYSYEDGDVDNYGEKIIEYLTRKYSVLFNPETAAKMEEIKERMDELDEGYNYFSVYDEDQEIYFQTYQIELPIKVPYYPLPQGLNAQKNMEAFKKYQHNVTEYIDLLDSDSMKSDIKEAFVDAVKMKHKKAYNIASKQISLSMAGMELSPDPDDHNMGYYDHLNIPQFVEIEISTPTRKEISGEQKLSKRNLVTIAPKFRIKFSLMVEISDDILDVLWGMEYVNYLDKNMDDILAIFENSKWGKSIQRTINKIHKDYMRAINQYIRMSENKKRKIKVKILK